MPEGPLAELLTLLDELSGDPEALGALADELAELRRKLPRALCADGAFQDDGWMRERLGAVRALLLQELLGDAEAEP